MSRFVDAWNAAWRMHAFRRQTLYSVAAIVLAFIVMELFLLRIEGRQGIVFADPLLGLFPPVDVHWIIYSIIYSAVLFGFVSLCLYPFAFLLTIRALIVLVIMRVACLFLLPLDPPPDIIPLTDPFMSYLGIPMTNVRGLFFAWPSSLLSLFVFTAQWKDLKIIFSAGVVAVSGLLLVQHTHYTIDIVASPVFALAAVAIAKWDTVGDFGSKTPSATR
jgi:hypothetical protein